MHLWLWPHRIEFFKPILIDFGFKLSDKGVEFTGKMVQISLEEKGKYVFIYNYAFKVIW